MLTILLGNLIVLRADGADRARRARAYGIPFPVLARASFGVLGSNVPAILRALVACGWFGIQTWIGGQAIHTMLQGGDPAVGAGPSPAALGFAVFWLWNMYIVVNGSESIKFLEAWAAPFLIVAGLALLAWAVSRAGGFGPIARRAEPFRDHRRVPGVLRAVAHRDGRLLGDARAQHPGPLALRQGPAGPGAGASSSACRRR